VTSWKSKLNKPLTGYAGAVILITAISLSLAALLIGLRANEVSENRERAARQASERAWCSVIIVMDDSYRQVPPATPAGKKLAEGIAGLRMRNCPPQPLDAPLPSTTGK